MKLQEALRIVADWVDAGLKDGTLDHYYWGYDDIAAQMRVKAEDLDG